MNEDEQLTDINEITQLLIRLRPARAEIDSRVVFYEAGLSAGQSPSRRPTYATAGAAALLAAIIIAPLGYRIGQTAAVRSASDNSTQVAAQVAEPDAVLSQKERPRLGQRPSVDAPTPIHEPKHSAETEMLARWIDPFAGLAKSAELARESGPTLAVFHSSLVSRQTSSQDWIDFPFSTTLARHRDWRSADTVDHAQPPSPFAVSDLQQLAQSLESAQ